MGDVQNIEVFVCSPFFKNCTESVKFFTFLHFVMKSLVKYLTAIYYFTWQECEVTEKMEKCNFLSLAEGACKLKKPVYISYSYSVYCPQLL